MNERNILISGLVLLIVISISTLRYIDSSNTNHIRNYTVSDFSYELTPAQKILLGEKININTADEKTFELLYRVGPALAERIISNRKRQGKFQSIYDLKRVYGIGEKIIESNRHLIEAK
jgi:competence ComEA-like helix-hairpin-helix protein